MSKKKSRLEKLGVKINYKDPLEGYRRNPTVRTNRGKVQYSAKEAKRRIKNDLLSERVKKMRPYFGDVFKPSSGYDLHDVSSWTPAQRAKVTKYWRVIAPNISRLHQARYYRDPKNLEAAITYTQQEAMLKGQRAALFPIAPGEKLSIKIRKGRVVSAKRNSVEVRKVYFDPDQLLEDPIEAARDALEQLEGARLYKLMFGPYESRGTFKTPDAVLNAMAFFIGRYDDEFDSDDPFSHHYGNWLGGIIGYFGRRETVESRVKIEDRERAKGVVERRRDRVRRRERIRRYVIQQAADSKFGPAKKKRKKRKKKK